MLLMVGKRIRGKISHEICHKYMKEYNNDNKSSYIMYWNVNNLYRWAMFPKLPADCFKWKKDISKFDENFIKIYDKNSDKGYIFEVDVEYSKRLNNLHNDLPFLRERMEIKKCHKLACNLYNKR